MKPDPTFEHPQRRRFIRRQITLILALLCIGSGYAVLAIPPEVPMDTAIPRGFIGIGLLLDGVFFALLNRAAPGKPLPFMGLSGKIPPSLPLCLRQPV